MSTPRGGCGNFSNQPRVQLTSRHASSSKHASLAALPVQKSLTKGKTMLGMKPTSAAGQGQEGQGGGGACEGGNGGAGDEAKQGHMMWREAT